MRTVSFPEPSINNSIQNASPEAAGCRLSTFKSKTSASLDNKETIFPRAVQRSLQRKLRKEFFGSMVSESMKACGTSFVDTSDETTLVKDKSRGVRFDTLMTCKNVNCPRCAPKHQRALREKTEAVFTKHLKDEKGKVFMATLTKGFYKSAKPKERRSDLVKTFGGVVKQVNKHWEVSICYIVEPTFKYVNGKLNIHYHVHALIGGNLTDNEVQELQAYIQNYWLTRGKNKCVRYISPKAQDIRTVDNPKGIAEYLAKAAAFELTGATTKRAKDDDAKTWFQYLYDLDGEPSTGDKKVVRQFLEAEKGTRKFSTNKTFRNILDSLNLEDIEEETDEEEVATFNVVSAREMLRYDDGSVNCDDILSVLERSDEACEDFKLVAATCDSYYYNNGYNTEFAQSIMLDGLSWIIDKYIHQNERRYWVDWRGHMKNIISTKTNCLPALIN